MNWEEARVACVNLTQTFSSFNLFFDLVSIHNDEENTFVESFMSVWSTGATNGGLGLRREAYKNDFEWSDRSLFSYNEWPSGFPNVGVNSNFY